MGSSEIQIYRPEQKEYASFYHGYIEQVEGEDAFEKFEDQQRSTLDLLQSIPGDKWDYRYEIGKWTIRELMIHVIDAERIFAYRALRLARNDSTALPGFDQDIYVPESCAAKRSAISIIDEYRTVRAATISLYKNLPSESLVNMAEVSGGPMSCRALAWIILGHEKHHCKILRERYL
jgi:hypothetical protein